MLCVDALKKGGVDPNAGEVLVTGASGGVGTVALALLSELGYKVAAVTGKADPDVAELLTKLGASSIVARSNFESDPKPLAKETYVGAVDTVLSLGSSAMLKDSMLAGVFLALVMSALKLDMLRI